MKRSLFALFSVVAFASLAGSGSPASAIGVRPPNVVFFLIDDLGFTDLGCMGSKLYETPHIDRLASQGMKFNHAYSACTVCSPTRAAVLTGKYPARLHVTDWIAGHKRPFAKLKIPDWTMYLPLEETTLAEVLKSAGYATASVGKWHLGNQGYEPTRQGFDVNIGGTQAGSPPSYFSPYNLPGIETKETGESLTERLTTEAEKFIEKNKDRPFFVYFPHYTVHTPLQAKPEVVAKYAEKIKRLGLADVDDDKKRPRDLESQHPQRNATYAAMIESMDQSVGSVTAKLEQLGLADDTIVIFTGDNGGLMSSTDNRPARVGKGSAYEGGVRVPLIVRYTRAIKPGVTTDAPVMSIDFLPTICELAKAETPSGIDGVSFAGLLRDGKPPARSELFWHYPHYHPGGATPYGAIRSGDWRLVEFYEDDRVELYDLSADEGERNDLAAKEPERAKTLRDRLHAWRTEVGAQMPTPNPDYDPGKNAAQDRPKPAAGKKKADKAK
jgi:arylsulfatase A-like enzyme